jgi:uncharacterized protein (DUF488 family)
LAKPQQKRPLKLPSNPQRVKAENKALWNEARSPDKADFYTVGYEGRTTDELLDALRSAGVKCVCDIRYNPVSMYRPELSKSNLQKRLESAGIQYIHLREWGVPKEIRAKAADSGTREIIWEWYDSAVVETHFKKNLHRFLNLGHPIAMMCVECDPTECHRHRLFMALEQHGLRGFDL